ncbi:MAG: TfuA-related McrA-glycine thioamidation protein [Euryarchaeota archaeon]|nr:TfuA-related McrA-glycine thioamidation protein [Euryarchaeota archaeon]
MSRPVVYLGPSLPVEEARALLDAEYRPPVKRGDLSALGPAEVVGIIDGAFLQNCSVGHREILSLLSRGVKVIGGGSMGALRAAEMQAYGMIGVGRIFQMYADGVIEGDDEVALVFDPASMEPLSEPMVNLRFLMDKMLKEGKVSAGEHHGILSSYRSIYYPRRTIAAFLDTSEKFLGEERGRVFRQDFPILYQDVKREDAISVIKRIGELV